MICWGKGKRTSNRKEGPLNHARCSFAKRTLNLGGEEEAGEGIQHAEKRKRKTGTRGKTCMVIKRGDKKREVVVRGGYRQ